MPPECGRLGSMRGRSAWPVGEGDAGGNLGRRRRDLSAIQEAWTSGDGAYVTWAASQLDSREAEFGPGSAEGRARDVTRALKAAGAGRLASQLAGAYLVNPAFRWYRAGGLDSVPRAVVRAMRADRRYITNRGVLSILLRSALTTSARTAPPS